MPTPPSHPAITAVIIAKDEALMLPGCLESLAWCDRVLVIDNGSKDQTAALAEQRGATVIAFQHDSFARLRTEALKRIKTPWLIYVDADERVTPTLAREILVQLETNPTIGALALRRTNIFYGQHLQAGGWQLDVLPRVFRLEALSGWHGEVHETPDYKGETLTLTQPLVHFSHRSTTDGLLKTAEWTKIEARLLYQSGLPPVTIFTILRKGLAEFWRRGILWRGYQDGTPGWLEAIIQGINKMLIYIQVWELQRRPTLSQTYEQLDKQAQAQWKQQSDLIRNN